jgi:hypothetical protein
MVGYPKIKKTLSVKMGVPQKKKKIVSVKWLIELPALKIRKKIYSMKLCEGFKFCIMQR